MNDHATFLIIHSILIQVQYYTVSMPLVLLYEEQPNGRYKEKQGLKAHPTIKFAIVA